MRRLITTLGLAALLALACGSCGEPKPEATPAPGSGEEPQATGFGTVDLTCSADDDCDTFHRYLTPDDRCCYTCTHLVASKKWVEQAMATCQAKSREDCPMKKCKGPDPVKCQDGKCVFDR